MKSKGLTLIEIIIVIALVGLIGTGAYSLFGYSNKTYKKGTNQYDIQSDQRIIADAISENLKYSYNIDILNEVNNEDSIKITNTSDPLYGYNYIYLQYNDNNGNGKCDDSEGVSIRKVIFDTVSKTYNSAVISNAFINGLVYNLTFSYSGGNTIKFELNTKKDNEDKFYLNTKINMMNAHLGSLPIISPSETIKIGRAIRFKLDPKTTSGAVIANYPPTANNVVITGNASIGEVLHGSYEYSDTENDIESGTVFRWEKKYPSASDTDWTEITSADTVDYTLTVSDFGMVVRFVVLPCAATGASPGNASSSNVTDVVTGTGISKPIANDLTIVASDKKLTVGCTLTANYSFSSDNNSIDNSVITWYLIKKDNGIDEVIKLQQEMQKTGRIYVTKSPQDEGGNIYFTVEPVDGSGVHGVIQQSSSVGPIKKN